ncbi:MAG: hypothetical protein ACKV2Q_24795 [Planctomycetaceae bacterium]
MFRSIKLCSVFALLFIATAIAEAQTRAAPPITFELHDSPTALKAAQVPLIVFALHGPTSVAERPVPPIAFELHGAPAASPKTASVEPLSEEPASPAAPAAPKPSPKKPIVYMRSASWCGPCRVAKKEIQAAADCPFELRIIPDEQPERALPRFTWEVDGKWFAPIDRKTGAERSGYYGVADLVAHWKQSQPRTEQPAASAGTLTVAADSNTRP